VDAYDQKRLSTARTHVRPKWQKKFWKMPYWPIKYGDFYGHVQGSHSLLYNQN